MHKPNYLQWLKGDLKSIDEQSEPASSSRSSVYHTPRGAEIKPSLELQPLLEEPLEALQEQLLHPSGDNTENGDFVNI